MNQPNQVTASHGHNVTTAAPVSPEPHRTLIDRDIQDEFNYEARRLFEDNFRKFRHDDQALIDFITASLSYFTQDGMSRIQINQLVTDIVR